MNADSCRNSDEYYIAVGLKKESRRLSLALRITEQGSLFESDERGKRIFNKGFKLEKRHQRRNSACHIAHCHCDDKCEESSSQERVKETMERIV